MTTLKQGIFGSAILFGSMILTGCGTSEHPVAIAPSHHSKTVSSSPSASGSTSSTTPSSRPVPASPSSGSATWTAASSSPSTVTPPATGQANATPTSFPTIIQTALQSLAHRTQLPLYAPTTYPGEAHTPLPITVQTQAGTTPTAFYQLFFNRGEQPIGSFTVRPWPSTSIAQTHILPIIINLPPNSLSGKSINLGSGISGTQTQWKDSEGRSITAITWHEGRWRLIVEAPLSQATQAVMVGHHISAYLHTTGLPVPNTQGWVIETFHEQNVTSQVSWNHNDLAFLTSSVGPWNSNLSGGYLSALNMAVHIQKY